MDRPGMGEIINIFLNPREKDPDPESRARALYCAKALIMHFAIQKLRVLEERAVLAEQYIERKRKEESHIHASLSSSLRMLTVCLDMQKEQTGMDS